MANYNVRMRRTASTTLSVGGVNADATRPRRGEIYDLIVGTDGTVGDNPQLWQLQRYTAAGTSTPVTPVALDPADATTESDAGENHTVEPTYTANLFLLDIPLNQRATFRWQAVRDDSRIVWPATASNGVGVATPVAAGAVPITATLQYNER